MNPRHAHGSAVKVTTGGQEWGVDRSEREVGVIRFREREGAKIESADHAGQPDDPRRIDLPPVVFAMVRNDGFQGGRNGSAVTEDTVIHAFVQRVQNGRRRFKIHIRHPHGQDVLAGVFLPFLRVRIFTVGGRSEVEGHGGVLAVNGQERGGSTDCAEGVTKFPGCDTGLRTKGHSGVI